MSDAASLAQITSSVNGSKTGWRTVRFGDVVRNVDSSVRNPLEQGIERFVGLEHLDPESLHIKRWGDVADGTSFTRRFKPGQVLFGKRRAYQRKAAVADFEGICSGDILVFEPKTDELLPELLPFVVQSDGFFEHALDTSAGSLSPRTKWADMARYEFALPPKEEQRRIARILWAVDSVLEKWTFALKEIDTVFKGFSSQIFENIFNLESLAINVKSRKIKRLIDVATLQRGHDLPTQQRKEGTIPIITIGASLKNAKLLKIKGDIFYVESNFGKSQ